MRFVEVGDREQGPIRPAVHVVQAAPERRLQRRLGVLHRRARERDDQEVPALPSQGLIECKAHHRGIAANHNLPTVACCQIAAHEGAQLQHECRPRHATELRHPDGDRGRVLKQGVWPKHAGPHLHIPVRRHEAADREQLQHAVEGPGSRATAGDAWHGAGAHPLDVAELPDAPLPGEPVPTHDGCSARDCTQGCGHGEAHVERKEVRGDQQHARGRLGHPNALERLRASLVDLKRGQLHDGCGAW
mmetsp:Transcript_26277/g.78544  ORF Transcript_26277/g.78544 Transcript_26277/m.78544 type:complete len:246 (-) Transcript_26277:640-1377(-)